jgi:tRNA modification GTPase
VLREGRRLAIVGQSNVGKSSIFNALLGYDRAIVSANPGTTRDLLAEVCSVDGIPLTLVDTAGWRESADEVEAEGIRRATRAAAAADVSLLVLDGSAPLGGHDRGLLAALAGPAVVAVNKCDLGEAWPLSALDGRAALAVRVSASTGAGLDGLRHALARALVGDETWLDDVRVTNVRHARLLERSGAALGRAAQLAETAGDEELVLAELREALAPLQEITGRRSSDAVLREIFARFCLGK